MKYYEPKLCVILKIPVVHGLLGLCILGCWVRYQQSTVDNSTVYRESLAPCSSAAGTWGFHLDLAKRMLSPGTLNLG